MWWAIEYLCLETWEAWEKSSGLSILPKGPLCLYLDSVFGLDPIQKDCGVWLSLAQMHCWNPGTFVKVNLSHELLVGGVWDGSLNVTQAGPVTFCLCVSNCLSMRLTLAKDSLSLCLPFCCWGNEKRVSLGRLPREAKAVNLKDLDRVNNCVDVGCPVTQLMIQGNWMHPLWEKEALEYPLVLPF